jgi:hypothetical protein
MLNLVSGLPDGALDWRPAEDAASLAGLALHILDVEEYLAGLAAGEDPDWAGENGSRMDESLPPESLMAEIERVDARLKAAIEGSAAFAQDLSAGEARRVGEALLEDMDHCAMHYGHMQLTRHLWEAANPGFGSGYQHWR